METLRLTRTEKGTEYKYQCKKIAVATAITICRTTGRAGRGISRTFPLLHRATRIWNQECRDRENSAAEAALDLYRMARE